MRLVSESETDYVRMRVRKLVAITATSAFFCLVIWYTSTSPPAASPPHHATQLRHNTTTKTILMWNSFFSATHFGHSVGNQLFHDYKCHVTDCHISDMRDGTPAQLIEHFDLVWFHAWDVPAGDLLRNKPPVRSPQQVYLFYLHESPDTFRFDFSPLDGFFNWTASYRTDSDIYMPYGWFSPLPEYKQHVSRPSRTPAWLEPRHDVNLTASSSARVVKDMVVWVVSNCVNIPSNRDVYVAELSRHIPVDVFGRCGTPCTGNRCDEQVLEKRYKFYLAFENSICGDYVTEKFYRTMSLDMVPVVYGGADYSKMAPPHSYIDAHDFDSPRDLAEYLVFLDNNITEYRKYFWWKKSYAVHQGTEHVVCEMCAMLHEAPRPVRVRYDLDGWWNSPGQCLTLPAGHATWIKRAVTSPRQMLVYGVQWLAQVRLRTTVLLVLTCGGLGLMLTVGVRQMRAWWRVRRRTMANMKYTEINKVVYN